MSIHTHAELATLELPSQNPGENTEILHYPTYGATVPEAMVFTTTIGSFQNQLLVTAAALPVATPNGRKRIM